MTLGLYKGNVLVRSRTSPNSLYDAAVASMEGGGSYDQTDAEGFLRIQGLPSRVLGKVRARRVLTRLRIWDCGMRIIPSQSAIRNPQS